MLLKSKVTSEDILTGSIGTTLIAMSIPTAIALSLNAIFNFVDRFYIAEIGKLEFVAIGMAFIVQSLIVAMAMGIGTGISTCLAKAIGAKDQQGANNIGLSAVFIIFTLSILTAIIGVLSLPFQISLMGIPDTISTHYKVYLNIIFLGSFSIYVPIILNAIFRGEGNMTTPMHIMVVGSLVNFVLDPILIFGLSQIPAMGIKGAAIATISARTVATVWAVFAVCKNSQHVTIFADFLSAKYKPTYKIRFHKELKKIISVGLPISLSGMIGGMVLGGHYTILASYGDETRVLFTMLTTYLMLVMFPVAGIARSVMVMCAQNMGANNHERSSKIYQISRLICVLLVASFSCAFVFFDDFFIGVFMNPADAPEYTKFAMSCFALLFPLAAISDMQHAYLVSHGLSMYTLMIKLVSIASLAMTYALQIYFGEKGVWSGHLLGAVISILLSYTIIYIYIEKDKIIKAVN